MSHNDPLIAYEDDPWNDTVHQPYTAWNQGYDACEQELPESLNPYPEGTGEHGAWAKGYECHLIQTRAERDN